MPIGDFHRVDNSVFYGVPLDGAAVSGRVAAVPGSLSDKALSMINDQDGAAQLARRREDVSPEALSSENAVLVNDGAESLSGQTVTLPGAGSVNNSVPTIFSSRPAKPLPPLPAKGKVSGAESNGASAASNTRPAKPLPPLPAKGKVSGAESNGASAASNTRPAKPLPPLPAKGEVSGAESNGASAASNTRPAKPLPPLPVKGKVPGAESNDVSVAPISRSAFQPRASALDHIYAGSTQDKAATLSGAESAVMRDNSIYAGASNTRPAKPLPPLPVKGKVPGAESNDVSVAPISRSAFQSRASALYHIYAEAIYAGSTQDKAATLSGAESAVMRDNSIYAGASNTRPAKPLPPLPVKGKVPGAESAVMRDNSIYAGASNTRPAKPLPPLPVKGKVPGAESAVMRDNSIYAGASNTRPAKPLPQVSGSQSGRAEPIYDVLENVESIDDGPSEESGKSTALL